MSFEAFGAMLKEQGGGCSAIAQAICNRIHVPYLKERESERMLGHRRMREEVQEVQEGNTRRFGGSDPERLEGPILPSREFRHNGSGEILRTDEWPADSAYEQLTEEVWTRDNWPDSFNDTAAAVAKVPNGITGVYYHRPSMNLVLVGPGGEKVGIRSTALMIPMVGLRKEGCVPLLALKKATVS